MLLWLASYPRSGNSFFREVLERAFGQESLSRYTTPGVNSRIEEMARTSELYVVKTHDLPEDDRPAIYLVRDGRDALVSYAWFHLMYDHGIAPGDIDTRRYQRTLRRLIKHKRTPFGTWSQNVQAWTSRPQTTLVRFEALIEAPVTVVDRALVSAGLDLPQLPDARAPTFDELHEKNPLRYRRGVVGSWKDEFPPKLLRDFLRRHGETLRTCGYEPDEAASRGTR